MYRHFVPLQLHSKADAFIANLQALTEKPTACPYCQHQDLYAVNPSSGYYRCKSCNRGFNRSLHTPFYRLAPLEWLPIIAQRRLCGQSYATIRHELDCTSWVVKRRVQVLDDYMQTHYPELYQWYQRVINSAELDVPNTVTEQVDQLKAWVKELLQATHATCPYCVSIDTQKVAESRARFRCKNCWRYFSNLKGSELEHLGRSENWTTMIDMLVAGNTNREIEQELNISAGTTTKAKQHWLKIMQQKDLLVLKEWVISAKR